MGATEIALNYVCPSLGCLMAALVFAGESSFVEQRCCTDCTDEIDRASVNSLARERALLLACLSSHATASVYRNSITLFFLSNAAPIQDLRRALVNRSLGALNPFPWVMMTGKKADAERKSLQSRVT
jgi:hypothetical protein